MTRLCVEAVGPLATVQDLGRPGFARIGVTESGAADRAALRLANRVVGNDESAAGIEVLLGGLELKVEGRSAVVAVTGAPAHVSVDGAAVPLCTAVEVTDGQRLSLGRPDAGLRSYLAVRGGLSVPQVLGSRATDPTTGVGPPILAAGRWLPVGDSIAGPVPEADVAAPYSPPTTDQVVQVVMGPRADWFTDAARAAFVGTAWEVTTQLDRAGVRLAGPSLERAVTRELPSEGAVRGAVQVPASGQPIVFLADHPTTGGYPVIAVVVDADTDRLAQLRPGERVRFAPRVAGWLPR